MIRKLNKLFIIPFIFLLVFTLTSCSTYKAVGLVSSNTSKGYSIKFQSLEGRYQKKMLKTKNDTSLTYTCKLESGEVNIYFKTPLESEPVLMCNLKAGDEVSNTFGYITTGHFATIIIETVSEAKGEFNFTYSYQP